LAINGKSLLRDPVAALDARGAEETTDHLGLRLPRDRRDRHALVYGGSALGRYGNICS